MMSFYILAAYLSFGMALSYVIIKDAKQKSFQELKVHKVGTAFCVLAWPLYLFALIWISLTEKRK